MRHRVLSLAIVPCALLTLTAACSDSTDPGDARNVVEFTLTGDRTGAFRVSAATSSDPYVLIDASQHQAAYLHFAETDTTPAFVSIVAVRPAGAGLIDLLQMYVSPDLGSQQLGGPFQGMQLYYGVPVSNGSFTGEPAASYFFAQGTVTIHELSATRFRGAFSATGFGGVEDVSIVNGSFTFGGGETRGVGSEICKLTGC